LFGTKEEAPLVENNDWVSVDLVLPFGSMATTAAAATITTAIATATTTTKLSHCSAR
jgi:hypothetical protein